MENLVKLYMLPNVPMDWIGVHYFAHVKNAKSVSLALLYVNGKQMKRLERLLTGFRPHDDMPIYCPVSVIRLWVGFMGCLLISFVRSSIYTFLF